MFYGYEIDIENVLCLDDECSTRLNSRTFFFFLKLLTGYASVFYHFLVARFWKREKKK